MINISILNGLIVRISSDGGWKLVKKSRLITGDLYKAWKQTVREMVNTATMLYSPADGEVDWFIASYIADLTGGKVSGQSPTGGDGEVY